MLKRLTLCVLAAAMIVPTLAATAVAEATALDVRAVDYDFKGIPAELKVGRHRFNFENRGTNAHELIVVRMRGWVNKSWDQLLRMDRKEAERRVEFIGASFAKPGKEGEAFGAHMRVSRYLAVCFMQNERNSKPHFLKGMQRRFHVSR